MLKVVVSKKRLIIITSSMLILEEINIRGQVINYPKTLNVLDGADAS